MGKYKICVVGGWCGNQMLIIADHLANLLEKAGYAVRITHHSVWENYSSPPPAHLVLQLLPAFTEKETGCPVINIKPLLANYEHPETITKVMEHVQQDYPLRMGMDSVPSGRMKAMAQAAR